MNEQERQKQAVKAFMEERLYWRVVEMADAIRSRQPEVARFLDVLANGLYDARNEVKVILSQWVAYGEANTELLGASIGLLEERRQEMPGAAVNDWPEAWRRLDVAVAEYRNADHGCEKRGKS